MALLLVGCAKEYDDSGLKERVSALETRVTALESNVQALQSAIGEGVFVAKVQEYADPDTGKTIGITVTYTNGDVKYFEISPKADYAGPVLGVIQSGSGALVWAVDGIAIEVGGKEVPVYQTPVFSIDEDGNLCDVHSETGEFHPYNSLSGEERANELLWTMEYTTKSIAPLKE